MPVYPGHQRTVLFDVKTHDETRELNKPGRHTSTVMGILMCDHGPTHVDAFNHIDSGPTAESIDQLPLDLFFTPAVFWMFHTGRRVKSSRPGTWRKHAGKPV